MPEKISIVKESGETISSNIVSVFMIPDTGKKYIITTENAVDPHGLTVLHVSEMVDGNLQKIATDDEWSSIKTIMRAIISGNVVSYQYLPSVETVNASSQYSRDISVSASAAKQMVDNYNAADKNASSTEAGAAPAPADGAPAENTDNAAPATDGQPDAAPVEATEAAPEPAVVPDPNSIFPTSTPQTGGDEVIPGISEVSGDAPAEAPQEPAPVAPAPATEPVPAPVDNTQAPLPANGVIGQNPVQQPVPGPDTAMDINTGMPISPMAVAQTMVENNAMQPNMVNNMGVGMNNEVQVVNASQVPTGQIVQDATTPMNGMNGVQMNMMPSNINPSFNPNASLDEVVVAAQEMFMEGVRNLVETIQEKVYRDLYTKEAALKAREEIVAQREQMLAVNPGMMSFNSGMMGMNQGLVPNNIMQNVGVPMQQMAPMQQNPQMFNQQNMMMQQQMSQMPQVMGGMMQSQLPTGPVTVSASNDVV